MSGARQQSTRARWPLTLGRGLTGAMTTAGAIFALALPADAPAASGLPVATRILHLVDSSRIARPLHGKPFPRLLTTVLRYPTAPARGPFGLIVFAHGFDVTPATYSRLLRAWAQAGFVVAAPVFPLERAGAPGGADGSDLINEPGDMSFVISSLLAESARARGALSGLIDPARIAVAGQSDGAEAALAAANATRLRDPRVRAAVILSGAEMSGIGGYTFAPGGPALLAVQGTADTSNEPRYTYAYFRAARRPKFLLRLTGARHLPPYTYEEPQLGTVERVSSAFLEGYLGIDPSAVGRLAELAGFPGIAELTAEP